MEGVLQNFNGGSIGSSVFSIHINLEMWFECLNKGDLCQRERSPTNILNMFQTFYPCTDTPARSSSDNPCHCLKKGTSALASFDERLRLLFLVLLQKLLHYVLIDPWRGTQSKTDTKWDGESGKIDKGECFGTKLFLIFRVGQVRPVSRNLVVSHGTNGNLLKKNAQIMSVNLSLQTKIIIGIRLITSLNVPKGPKNPVPTERTK